MQSARGAALISVLFITAIITMIAVAFTVRMSQLIRFELWDTRANQIMLALQGVQYWGVAKLLQVPLSSKPMKMGPIQYHNVEVEGVIVDQQGLFNINLLMQRAGMDRFMRLVKQFDPKYSTQQAQLFVKAMQNRQRFIDVSELLTIPSFPTALYRRLAPYLTALPINVSTLNINHVSALVLMTLTDNLSLSKAQAVVQCVKGLGPFHDMQRFNNLCLAPYNISTLPNLVTSSRYYLIVGQGKIASQQRTLRVMVYLKDAQGQPEVVAVWRMIS